MMSRHLELLTVISFSLGLLSCTDNQKDESLAQFAIEPHMTSSSLELKTRKAIVPLVQNAAAQLTGAVKLRREATCIGGPVKRSAYFSLSSPSQLHSTSPCVSSEDHLKRNLNVVDRPEDSIPRTIPDSQHSAGVEVESHIQCFDDLIACLDVDKVL